VAATTSVNISVSSALALALHPSIASLSPTKKQRVDPIELDVPRYVLGLIPRMAHIPHKLTRSVHDERRRTDAREDRARRDRPQPSI
jgi:hypothetical protein